MNSLTSLYSMIKNKNVIFEWLKNCIQWVQKLKQFIAKNLEDYEPPTPID